MDYPIHTLLCACVFQFAGAAPVPIGSGTVSSMPATGDSPAVALTEQPGKVVLSNGRITATIDKATSTIT